MQNLKEAIQAKQQQLSDFTAQEQIKGPRTQLSEITAEHGK